MAFLNVFRRKLSAFKSIRLYGMLINLALVFFGIILSYFSDIRKVDGFYGVHLKDHQQIVQLMLEESPVEKNASYKITADVESIRTGSDWINSKGKILVYFEKDSLLPTLLHGDRIVAKIRPEKIHNAGNPGEFDYQKYLERKGIYYRAYCKTDCWTLCKGNSKRGLKRVGERLRKKLLSGMKDNGIMGDEFAVASAILLGADDYLDKELRSVYTGAGAMHVLCVSGLHVGILFLILNIILKPLSRNRSLNIVRILIIMLILWFYAVLTGLAPSVSRSALMFSLFSLGSLSGKKNISYNILAASAFILILNNPNVIFETGFQLSYSAVAAILVFYPFISKWFCPKNKVLKFFWDGCAVSIAANLGTAPIVIYYFNQFPNYFILSNIALLILAPLVLSMGIAFFCFMIVPYLNSILALGLKGLIIVMNNVVLFVEALPGALSENLNINSASLVLLFLMIFFISDFLVRKRIEFLRLSLISIILISGTASFAVYRSIHQNKLIIYNLSKNIAVDYISGSQSLVVTDCDQKPWMDVYSYQIRNTHVRNRINKFRIERLDSEKAAEYGVVEFGVLGRPENDVVIARYWNDTLCNLSNVIYYPKEYTFKDIQHLKELKLKQVIIPSDWPVWKQKKMEVQCDSLELPFFSLSRNGAYILNF